MTTARQRCHWPVGVQAQALHPDGSIKRYKARWVGVDFGETFTPVVKPATIRTVLTLVAGRHWPTRQLDVSNAFLHGHLDERVLCQQTIGFVDAAQPNAVCLLSKSLYGLQQAPRAWFTRIAGFLRAIGFVATCSDSSLFVLRRGMDMAFLLLYIDDMVLSTSTEPLLQDIVACLQSEFAVKDMGPLRYFLGVDIQ